MAFGANLPVLTLQLSCLDLANTASLPTKNRVFTDQEDLFTQSRHDNREDWHEKRETKVVSLRCKDTKMERQSQVCNFRLTVINAFRTAISQQSAGSLSVEMEAVVPNLPSLLRT